MPNHSDELRRAIQYRSDALRRRAQDLQGQLEDKRSALWNFIDLVEFFPDALDATVEAEWERNRDAESRSQILRPLLRHTTDVRAFVDEWLGGPRPSAPLYLHDSVERACKSMGLGEPRAIISAGPPDNFTTVVGGIEGPLFRPLGPLCPTVPEDIDTDFVLIQAPLLEGSEALWHPILLGHELAHIAIDYHSVMDSFNLNDSFDSARTR